MFTRTLQGHTHQGLLGLHLEHTALLLHLWHCCLLASTQIHQHGDLTIWIQVFEGNSLYWDNVRQQFNRNVTTLLTHNDLSSDLTVLGGSRCIIFWGCKLFASKCGCWWTYSY